MLRSEPSHDPVTSTDLVATGGTGRRPTTRLLLRSAVPGSDWRRAEDRRENKDGEKTDMRVVDPSLDGVTMWSQSLYLCSGELRMTSSSCATPSRTSTVASLTCRRRLTPETHTGGTTGSQTGWCVNDPKLQKSFSSTGRRVFLGFSRGGGALP